MDVTNDQITLDTAHGPMPVFSAQPADAPVKGGVIVLQDIFGVTDYVHGVCVELAEAGWWAMAPHLYHRTGSPVIPFDRMDDGRPHSSTLTGEGILTDVDAVLAGFATDGIPTSHVAVVGFCMGGTLGFFLATRRDLAAVSSFYGHVESSPWPGVPAAVDSSADLRVPWLGLFGDQDAAIPVSGVETLRGLLTDSGVPTEIVRYPEAKHAFHRAATPDWYHEPSAKDAWQRTLDWFETHVPALATT